MRRFFQLLLIASLFLIFLITPGCRGEKSEPKINDKQCPAEVKKTPTPQTSASTINHPPKVVAAEILPDPAYTNMDLRVEAKVEDPEGDWVELNYQWIFFKEKDQSLFV